MILENKHYKHLFRIVPKINQEKKTVDDMLTQEVCLYFRINNMNWPLLDKKLDWYHEITLQIYYKSGQALTNRTVIPLNQGLETGKEHVSWIF